MPTSAADVHERSGKLVVFKVRFTLGQQAGESIHGSFRLAGGYARWASIDDDGLRHLCPPKDRKTELIELFRVERELLRLNIQSAEIDLIDVAESVARVSQSIHEIVIS